MSDKNNKLRDLRRKYASIRCESEYCSCSKCSNREICDKVSKAIKRLENE